MKKSHLKPKHVEHLLLKRLHFLGWVLIVFGCAAFSYALIARPQDDSDPENALEASYEVESSGPSLEPPPKLRLEILYLGICTFWVIGTSCVIFSWRRKRLHKQLMR
jgi:hypothetical protein